MLPSGCFRKMTGLEKSVKGTKTRETCPLASRRHDERWACAWGVCHGAVAVPTDCWLAPNSPPIPGQDSLSLVTWAGPESDGRQGGEGLSVKPKSFIQPRAGPQLCRLRLTICYPHTFRPDEKRRGRGSELSCPIHGCQWRGSPSSFACSPSRRPGA